MQTTVGSKARLFKKGREQTPAIAARFRGVSKEGKPQGNGRNGFFPAPFQGEGSYQSLKGRNGKKSHSLWAEAWHLVQNQRASEAWHLV